MDSRPEVDSHPALPASAAAAASEDHRAVSEDHRAVSRQAVDQDSEVCVLTARDGVNSDSEGSLVTIFVKRTLESEFNYETEVRAKKSSRS